MRRRQARRQALELMRKGPAPGAPPPPSKWQYLQLVQMVIVSKLFHSATNRGKY
jgi:hypothetical protein